MFPRAVLVASIVALTACSIDDRNLNGTEQGVGSLSPTPDGGLSLVETAQQSTCLPNPCLNNGTCQPDGSCVCPPGFTGSLCQTNDNDCADDPCLNGSACVDLADGFGVIACPDTKAIAARQTPTTVRAILARMAAPASTG